MSALVTGAYGFTGVHLIRRLRRDGELRIVGLDRVMPATCQGQPLMDAYYDVDLDDCDQVEKVVEEVRPDWVFHLAGMTDGNPVAIYRTNLLSTVVLLEALLRHAPQARVLLVGSAAEYGLVPAQAMPVTEDQPCNPIGAYGSSKHAMTIAALEYSRRSALRVVIARPFNIIGSGMPTTLLLGAILSRAKVALAGPEPVPIVKVGALDAERDFIAVDDVVEAYRAMILANCWGEVFNICSGRPIAISVIIDWAFRNAPRPIKIEVDPSIIKRAGASTMYGDYGKASRAFGFRPATDLEFAIREAWRACMKDDSKGTGGVFTP